MKIPANAEQVPRIKSMGDAYVILTNGRRLDVDAIVFCTGYKYDFSFLSPDCGISVKNERITPLYKHIFNINHTTMSFVGILKQVLLFRCSYMQAQIVCSVLKGEHCLPPKEKMLADEERQIRSWPVGRPPHDLFGRLEISYYEEMKELFGIEFWPDGVRAIYDRVEYELLGKDATFKDINFVLSSDKSSYKELPKHEPLDGYSFAGSITRGDM